MGGRTTPLQSCPLAYLKSFTGKDDVLDPVLGIDIRAPLQILVHDIPVAFDDLPPVVGVFSRDL